MNKIIPTGTQSKPLNIHWTTPLHVATVCGHIETIDQLLATRVWPIDTRDSFGNTPLMQLAATTYVFPWCEDDVLCIAQHLCTCGAEVNALNYEGCTAEMLACQNGYMRVAFMLHEKSHNFPVY
jgi:ankyrin repeat protein